MILSRDLEFLDFRYNYLSTRFKPNLNLNLHSHFNLGLYLYFNLKQIKSDEGTGWTHIYLILLDILI